MNSSIEIPYWLYIFLIQFAVLLSVVSIFLFYKLKNSRIKIKTLERDQKTNTESIELTPNTEDEEPAQSENASDQELQDENKFLQDQIQALLKQEQQADMKDKHQIEELKRHLSEKNTAYEELKQKFSKIEEEHLKLKQEENQSKDN